MRRTVLPIAVLFAVVGVEPVRAVDEPPELVHEPPPRTEVPLAVDEPQPEPIRWLPEDQRCDEHRGRRFCDGPRRVPQPHGIAAERAERLGLGTFQAASKLLRSRPRTEWAKAANFVPREQLVWPVPDGRFGRGVGFTRSDAPSHAHDGVDIEAHAGAEVVATAEGLVAYADNGVRGYGNLLVVLHAEGAVSVYAHLSEIRVFPGQLVRAGQVVAAMGNTGISRGTHLHFEWHFDGDPIDPMPRFPAQR